MDSDHYSTSINGVRMFSQSSFKCR